MQPSLFSSSSEPVSFSNRAVELMNARKISQTNRDTFQEVLKKTSNLTSSNARDLLSGLSSQEKEAVRAVHGLAEPFYIQGLSDEGAYNLLCQPGESKDLDNNGFYSIGAGLFFSFPPPNAPESVQKSWEEATAGKSSADKMMLQMSFVSFEICANIKYDSNHNPVGVYFPTEPGYTNIYAQPNFSYQNLVNRLKEYLDNNRPYMSTEQYQLHKNFALDFEAALVRNGAN